MTEKRTKEIKIRLTEDEHAALLARCASQKLAEWMRETCLDVRKPKARKIPSLIRSFCAHWLALVTTLIRLPVF